MTTEGSLRLAYKAIGEYLDQADAYLAGTRASLPDANLLCREWALLGGPILRIACGEDRFGPFVAIKIEHGDEDHDPRLFDPWCVPAILFEYVAGLSLRWHDTDQKGKRYLRLMVTPPDRAAGLGIPVTRAVANSSLGMATNFIRDHKDIRRDALTLASAVNRRHPPKFGRDDIVQLACKFYAKNCIADVLDVPLDVFKAQLARAYKAADDLHANRYSDEAD